MINTNCSYIDGFLDKNLISIGAPLIRILFGIQETIIIRNISDRMVLEKVQFYWF